MKASYKFFKHKDGASAFAEIGIESAPSPEFSIKWANDLKRYEQIYGNAVRQGIAQSLRWHRDLGGSVATFTVSEFVEMVVDTKEDAVKCASAMAAWKALGHSETELAFDFDGTWHVAKST